MNSIICTWSVKLPKGSIAVWPDGCRDLIAIIGKKQPLKVICSGLDVSVRQVVCTNETRFFGVRLTPGVTFPWERIDSEKMRMDVSLSQYLPSCCQCWDFLVDHGVVFNELIKQIESLTCSAPNWVVDYLQELWTEEAGICGSLSERSIRRNLVQATGAPPKFWQSLARARKVGIEISRSDNGLASIAADYGFSDQAHMNREIRRWFGCTPMMLRKNREQAMARLTAPNAFNGF
jgi:AraC-like DNA-binding protein